MAEPRRAKWKKVYWVHANKVLYARIFTYIFLYERGLWGGKRDVNLPECVMTDNSGHHHKAVLALHRGRSWVLKTTRKIPQASSALGEIPGFLNAMRNRCHLQKWRTLNPPAVRGTDIVQTVLNLWLNICFHYGFLKFHKYYEPYAATLCKTSFNSSAKQTFGTKNVNWQI